MSKKNQIEAVLFAMVQEIENRHVTDSDTCAQLVDYAERFGQYLRLQSWEIQSLGYGAYLHDIGIVGIPDSILLKRGPLTLDEQAVFQQHILIGEKICQPLSYRPDVLKIIRHHHGRWDGSGYPDNLIKHEIPWLAQVFQILDIYVALTSDRPYKLAVSPTKAIAIIRTEGKQGWRNPFLVEHFITFLKGQQHSSLPHQDVA